MVACPDVLFEKDFFDNFIAQKNENMCCMFITKKPCGERRYAHLRLRSNYETDYILSYSSKYKNSYLAGSCFFLGSRVVEKLDLPFDEDIFLYWEEYVLASRLRKLGYPLITNSLSIIRSDNSFATSINSHKFMAKSFVVLMAKFPELRNVRGITYILKRITYYLLLTLRHRI